MFALVVFRKRPNVVQVESANPQSSGGKRPYIRRLPHDLSAIIRPIASVDPESRLVTIEPLSTLTVGI